VPKTEWESPKVLCDIAVERGWYVYQARKDRSHELRYLSACDLTWKDWYSGHPSEFFFDSEAEATNAAMSFTEFYDNPIAATIRNQFRTSGVSPLGQALLGFGDYISRRKK